MSLLIQEEAYACASDSGSLRRCTHETGLGYSYVETRSTSKNIPVTAGRIHMGLPFDFCECDLNQECIFSIKTDLRKVA